MLMNRTDVTKLIDKIRVAYPGKKYFETKDDLAKMIDIWLEMFEVYSPKFMGMVVTRAIRTSDYPPTFSTIAACLDELQTDYQKQIRDTKESIAYWETCLECSRDNEEREKYLNNKNAAEEELKDLEEFKFYEDER